MAYNDTSVPVSRSQEEIRKLIMRRGGSKVAMLSDPPLEGFEAQVMIAELPYRIRIVGECQSAPQEIEWHRKVRATTNAQRQEFRESEERRVWRVIYWYTKSLFETADANVKDLRELMLPHMVTNNGQTVAERMLPKLDAVLMKGPSQFLLAAHSEG